MNQFRISSFSNPNRWEFIFIYCSLSKQTEKQASNKVKLIAIAVGILVTSLVFVVEHLGSIFQIVNQIGGLVPGALFSMFALGMTSRSANTKVRIVIF